MAPPAPPVPAPALPPPGPRRCEDGAAPTAPRRTELDPTVVDRLRAAGCVFAEDEARLLTEQAAAGSDLAAMGAGGVAGEPLEHVLGWAGFGGLRLAVGPGVFVPRRRTEFLVEQALRLPGTVVLDLCCGSGALGAAVAAARPGVELVAADVDPVAVRFARTNL